MNIEEKKADFMRRFKASRERRRTGKEAESFCVL